MEDVRFYDFEFNLLHIEHDIVSCNWKLYANSVGSFEMHFPLKSLLVQVASENRYLVAVQGEKQAIITGRQFNTEGILYGRSINWILTRFCVPECFDTESLYEKGTIEAKDAQSVCRYILTKYLGHIDNFLVEENQSDVFDEVTLQKEGISSVFELIQDCLSQNRDGHSVFFDVKDRVWRFRPFTVKKSLLVLSEANRNCCDIEYTEDLQNFFVNGWYEQAVEDMGDWDAHLNNPPLSNGRAENYAKAYRVTMEGKEFDINFSKGDYIFCKNKEGIWEKTDRPAPFPVQLTSDFSGIYAWEKALASNEEQEAKNELREDGAAQEETRIKTYQLIYGKDYALGDVLRLEVNKGSFRENVLQQVSGVHLWYEAENAGEEPILVKWEEGYGLQS